MYRELPRDTSRLSPDVLESTAQRGGPSEAAQTGPDAETLELLFCSPTPSPGECEGFFKDYSLFLERGREGEKHQCVVASRAPPTACDPGMCQTGDPSIH